MRSHELVRMLEGYGAVLVRSGKHLIYAIGDERFLVPHGSRTHAPAVTRKMEKRAKSAYERLNNKEKVA